MTWHVLIMHFPPDLEKIEDVPRDYQPPPLGTPEELAEIFRRFDPDVECITFVDPISPQKGLYFPSIHETMWCGMSSRPGEEGMVDMLSIRHPHEAILAFIREHTQWTILYDSNGMVL
jgi:hypothetical protein